MKDKISIMIPEDKLLARIDELGKQITEDYKGEPIHLVGILKGSVFFMCALAERIDLPVTLDFMQVSSYGDGTKSSGIVRIKTDVRKFDAAGADFL